MDQPNFYIRKRTTTDQGFSALRQVDLVDVEALDEATDADERIMVTVFNTTEPIDAIKRRHRSVTVLGPPRCQNGRDAASCSS